MTEYFLNNNSNNSSSDSSIFRAIIREEDLTEKEKIDKISREANKFIEKILLEQKVHAKISQEAYDEFMALLSQMELHAKNNESKISESVWETIYSWIEPILNMFGINTNSEINRLLLKKEKEKSWLFSIIKSLLAKLFKQNLSWEERLNKEIAELQEKLDSGGWSSEELAKILERLAALQTMKIDFFKSQISAAWIILGVISMFLGYDLGVARSTEIAHEKHEKIDKISEKLQVANNIEIKITEKKELQQNVKDIIGDLLRNYKNHKEIKGTEKPNPLLKLDLRLSDLMRPILDAQNGILNALAKPATQEKPKQTAPVAPPTTVPQPQLPVKEPEVKFVHSHATHSESRLKSDLNKERSKGEKRLLDDKVASDKTARRTLTGNAQITKSINEQATDNLCTEFLTQFTCAAGKLDMSKQNTADTKLDNEKVLSELNEMKKIEHLSESKNVSCGRSM